MKSILSNTLYSVARAQAVTFLWRTAGCPEPESDNNPFVDVVNGGGMADYYKAILWASEQGITNGIDETHFAPNDPVTRAQFVTFLWRHENKSETAESSDETDEVTDAEETAEPSQQDAAMTEENETAESSDEVDEGNDTAEIAEPSQQDAARAEENETAEGYEQHLQT